MIYSIPNKITELRLHQGYSMRRLAKKAQVSNSTISAIEKAEKTVNPYTAKRIADVLNVDITALFVLRAGECHD